MGRGWRRAFCTSVGRDDQEILQGGRGGGSSEQLKNRRLKLGGGGGGFFSSSSSTSSNPSTPRLQTPPPPPPESPRPPPPPPTLQCKTTTTTPRPEIPSSNNNKHPHHHRVKESSPRLFQFSSSSSSPSAGTRSPSRFALFKTALRLSRSRCGICAGSVTSSGGGEQRRTAVFTAECSHVFHFPCISTHVRTHSSLVCPVCSASWHEVPLLSSSLLLNSNSSSSPHPTTTVDNNNNHRQRQGGASAVCKVYDDDESLQPSPTSRSTASAAASSGSVQLQFNPIPEEEEEEEEEEEDDINAIDDEKQGGGGGGHLHNRQQQPRQGRDANTILHVMPEATALLSTERSHQIYVVAIKVKAPSIPPKPATATTTSTRTRQAAAAAAAAMSLPPSLLDPSQRAPIDLVTVLDASGSMTPPKLQMLKRAMRLLISSLGPADRLSIVAFSNVAAKRLLPLRRMSRQGQRSARQIVDRLVICGSSSNNNNSCSSSSCAGDALRKATKVLEDRRERNPVATIMLLSDVHSQQQQQQQHNRQQRNSSSSSQCSATRFAHLEIPIHDSTSPAQQKLQQHVKQSILTQVNDEDDAALANCVNGLVSVVLQDVNLQFAFPSGIISSVYSYTTQGRGSCADIGRGTIAHGEGGKSVRLGDMYAGEERELLVEIRVPKTVIVGSHHHAAAAALSMSVLCGYRDPVTRELIQCGERPLAIVLGMTLPYPSQSHHHPTLLRSSSSSSAAITTTATINGSQEEQLLLRNLFVITRAMAESRRLVDLNQLDMAVNLISSARTLILKQSNSSNISTNKKFLVCLERELAQLLQQQQQQRRRQQHPLSPSQRRSEQAVLLAETSRSGGGGEQPLTPTSAWRAAEQLAKVAIMRKSLNRVSDLHGLENARF